MIEMGEKEHNINESLFKTIYNDSPIGIELYDSNGKLIDLNQSCMELFGVSSKDDVKGFDLLNDPNIPKVHLTKLKQRETVKFESSFDFELVKKKKLYKTKKSGKIYLDILITPLFLGDNKVISNYLVQIQDITDNKIAEHKLIDLNKELDNKVQERTKQLNRSEANWRVLVEEAPDIILTVDRNGDILYVNKVSIVKTREEAIGTNVLEYISADYHEIAKNSIEKVFQTGESGYYEASARGPNNTILWYSTRLGAIKKGENVTSVMLLARDITERKNIEQILEESEEKFRTITEQSLMGIAILQDDRFRYVNKQIADIFGYSPEEMKNWKKFEYAKLIHPDDQDMALEQARKKQLGLLGAVIHYQFRGITKKGKVKWLEIYSNSINYRDEIADLITIIDISDKRKVEQKLLASEEKYRTLIDNIVDLIFEIDLDGKITYLSSQSFDMLGYKPEELINQNAFRFIHPDDQEKVLKNQNYVINTGEVGAVEFRIRHKKDHYIIVSSRGQLIEIENKKKIVGLFRNITERKKIEEKLQEEKERVEMYLNLVNVIIVALDQNGNISMINKKGNDILGWNEGDLIGKNWFENCLPSRDRERVSDYFKKLIKGELEAVPFYENPVMTKYGDEKFIAWSTILIKDSEGNLRGILSSGEDITERKKAEEKIRGSEKRLMDLIESVPVGISITTPEGKTLVSNSQAFQIFGYSSKEEFLSIPVINLYQDPRDREKFLELHEKGLVKDFEVKFKRKDGNNFWGSLTSVAHTEGDQSIFISSFQDITDRKITEIKILQSEAELSAIYNYTPIAILLLDSERRIRKINKFALKFTNRREEELFGIHGGEALRCLYSIEDPRGCGFSEYCQGCIIRNTVLDTFKTKIPHINVEATLYLLPDSEVDKFHLLISTVPLEVEGEDRVLVSIIDITERIKAEQGLKESEERYRNFIENFQGIAFQGYKDFSAAFFHGNVEEITGYQEEDFVSGRIIWNQIIHPDDLTIVNEKVKIFHVNSAETDKREYRIINKNGGIHSIIEYNQKFYDNIINKEGVRGVIIDYTKYKEAEQLLIESEEKYRKLFNNAPFAIVLFNTDGFILDCNEASSKITGYHKNELVGKNFKEFDFYVDIQKALLEEREEAIKQGEISTPREILLKKKDKNQFWARSYLDFIHLGSETCLQAIIQDVTEQKIAEGKLIESEERFKYLVSSNPAIIYTSNTSGDYGATFISDNVEDLTGYMPEDFTNDANFWLDHIHPEDKAQILSQLSELYEMGYHAHEYRFKFKDGIYHWMRDELKLVSDENGDPSEIIGFWIDITEQKIAEHRLKESEKRFKYLVSSSPSIIYTAKTTGDYGATFISDNVEEKWGYDPEIFMTDSEFWLNHVHLDDRDRALTELSDLFEKDHIIYDYRFKLNSGSYHWMRDEVMLVRDEYGNPIETIGSVIDITERVKAEQELKESETRYRDLFENSPIALFEQDFSELKSYIDNLRDSGVVDFEKYLDENPVEIMNFSSMIKLIDVNRNALELYKANNKDDFIGRELKIKKGIHQHIPPEVLLANKGEILAFINGDTTFESEIATKTFSGETIYIYGKTLIIPGFEITWSKVIVSLLDITDRIKAEQKLKNSEEKYRTLSNQYKMLLESITDGVYALNRDWEYILINKNAEALVNMSVEKLMGRNIFEVFPGIEHTPFFKKYERVMNTGNADRVIDSFTLPDGLTRYYEVSVYPIEEGILCIGKNVTEEKEIEQKIKESEEKFRTIAEQSSLGMIIQQDGFIKFANSAVSDIIEYPLEVIHKWTAEETLKFIYKEDLPLIIDKLKQRQEGDFEPINQYECRAITKSSKIKWINVYTKPIIYQEKNAVLSTFIDITEKKKVEEELKEVSRVKSELLSRTSHELKTPLVSIKGYADLLLSQHYEELDFYTISVLHEIKQGCYRLESLIKDLLETSKLESGEIQLNKSEEDLAFLLKFCIRDLKGLLEMRKHELILDIQSNMITMVEKERIYEVVMNLLSNAIKYTPPNGQISIKSEIKEKNYIISVKDNGIGLAKDEIDKIFKKFGKIERYGKGMDVVSEGSGLGLYISKKIIELHGGEIWVDSEGRDKGSTFFFSLPIIKK